MPLPSGIRLRASCEPCTASKVRCSKQKPSCHRCAERGVICQYKTTKKTGRPSRDQTSSKQDMRTAQAGDSTLSSAGRPTLGIASHINRPDQETSLFAAPEADIFDIPPGQLDFWDPALDNAYDNDNSEMLAFLDTDSNSLGTDSVRPRSVHDSAAGAQISSLQTSPQVSSWCDRSPDLVASTAIAMQVLDHLLSTQEEVSVYADASSADAKEIAVELFVDETIARNRMALEKITTALNPVRAQDGYVLVLLCLSIHKIISTYARAYQYGERQCVKASTSRDPLYEESPGALQRLVNELFRIRFLVVSLGKTIKLTEARVQVLCNTATEMIPTSSSTLLSMHSDLRKRLSDLYIKSNGELQRFWT